MLLARPKFQLRSLPVPVRWEVTRRHPYYQIYRPGAVEFYEGAGEAADDDVVMGQISVAVLGQIGVSGFPPSPQTEFAALGGDSFKQGWLAGAVHPISLRGLAGILLAGLTNDGMKELASLFQAAASGDDANWPQNQQLALLTLQRLQNEAFNSYVDEPFVSINPAASKAHVSKELSSLMKGWKRERGLPQRRDRSEKFSLYFRVWDLREGWEAGVYESRKEKTLLEVAQLLKLPVQTVVKRYKRAFELIIGHEYTPENWYRAFGVLKLSRLSRHSPGRVGRRRPLQSRGRRDVPESRLARADRAPTGVVASAFRDPQDAAASEFISDIRQLIAIGRSDDEIIEEMELPAGVYPELKSLRKHSDSSDEGRRKK